MKQFITLFVPVVILLAVLTACTPQSQPAVNATVAMANTAISEPSVGPTLTPTLVPKLTATRTPKVVLTSEITVTPITDIDVVSRVFDSPELGITVHHPLGWDARLNLDMGGILVVDDFNVFRKGGASAYADAIGVLILSVPQEFGSAEAILKRMQSKLGNLSAPNSPITVEKLDGQEFAWAEYTVTSPGSKAQVHYFLTVITNNDRAAAAFTTVFEDRQEEVRPIYRSIVSSIKLNEK